VAPPAEPDALIAQNVPVNPAARPPRSGPTDGAIWKAFLSGFDDVGVVG
jgi:hypothetical protein